MGSEYRPSPCMGPGLPDLKQTGRCDIPALEVERPEWWERKGPGEMKHGDARERGRSQAPKGQ